MSRTMSVLALFVLVVAAPSVLAGPPQGASGKMVLDEVAEGLRKYRNEKDLERRVHRLDKLAETHDPRVDVILGEMLSHDYPDNEIACWVICRNHLNFTRGWCRIEMFYALPIGLWKENEADLRRRAKQLP
jgi:hypothetical protein